MGGPAVFLDRDGVINRSLVRNGLPCAPIALSDFEILPEVPHAIARLRSAGFRLVIATNQPDVARGLQSRAVIDAMHARIRDELGIDDIRVCFEIDGPDCRCYKPKPGMLLDAAADHDIALDRSYMVGDRWRDVDCARAAGCLAVFIDRGYAESLRAAPDFICADLAEAAEIILSHSQTRAFQ